MFPMPNLFKNITSVFFTVFIFSSSVLAHTGHTGAEPNPYHPYHPYLGYAGALVTFTIFASVVYYFLTKDDEGNVTGETKESEEEV